MLGQDDNGAQTDDISAMNPTLNTSDTSTPPAADTPALPTPPAPADSPAPEPPEPAEPAVTPPADPAPSVTPDTTSDADDLLALKKQAIEELSPLLDKLDQTPEEKFKTTMMMIQATDSDHLIKNAHQAALAISDEKVRAQALLDIVNEINYFTQPKDAQTD